MKYTYKQIWLINFPVMMSILMEQLINITDAVFLGHVGEIELGASALAGIYYLAIYMLGFGFSIGLQVMIARRNGEQHYKETGRTFFQGLYFLMVMAIMLCLLIHLVSPFILQQLITSDEIYQAVIRYLNWRSFGLLFSFPFLAFRAFLVGVTNTKLLSGAALTAVCINIPFNYLLIFKLDMGISGAAMASSIAEFGAFLILLLYMCKTVDKKKYGLSAVYDGRLLMKLLQLSVWSMLHAFISVAPWFLFFVAIEHLGKTELAISNITRSVSTLFFVIVNSFASTTGSLVSNLIGGGQGKELFPVCRKVLRLGYVVGLPLILTALWGNQWIIGFYTNNDYLVKLAFWPFIVMLLNYRKGLLIPLSIFRGGTASGPSILQLSSFTNKLMELLFPHPRIFDHFPNRTANDPSTILTVLVRNSACINILRSNHQIFLAQAIENAPSIPHICLKTRLQGQILVFPYRSNKKALKAELDRQNATSYQTCIVIAETLDDARKLNHFLDTSHFKTPLLFSTDASLKNPEIPLLKHLYQFTNGHMECLALSDT